MVTYSLRVYFLITLYTIGYLTLARDRKETEQGLINAAGRVLARDGFKKLGVNAIAREAGVDKVLIYRYFDGLSGLIKAYARQGDFWPSVAELIGDQPESFAKQATGLQIGHVLERYVAAIRQRPLTLHILAWEMVERNELTTHLEEVRETTGIQLFSLIKEQKTNMQQTEVDPQALVTLFAASINYLAARSVNIKLFNGINIADDAAWDDLVATMKKACCVLIK